MLQAQSLYSILLKGRFNVYEMRILLKVVQSTRVITSGHYQALLTRRADTSRLSLDFAVSLSELAGGKSHNYEGVKRAARAMNAKKVEWYDKPSRTWHLASLIDNVELEERTGVLRFSVARWLIDYICDFSNGGYRVYDFERAMSLRNAFTARLYLMTCSQSSPVYFTLEELRGILGVGDKYKSYSALLRKCVNPAMEELEREGLNGFYTEAVRELPDNKKSRVLGLRFHPVKRAKPKPNIGEQIEDMRRSLPMVLTQYLLQAWRFSTVEITNNLENLKAFCNLPDWQNKFIEISDRARRLSKGHGYLIKAMKREVAARSKEKSPARVSQPAPE